MLNLTFTPILKKGIVPTLLFIMANTIWNCRHGWCIKKGSGRGWHLILKPLTLPCIAQVSQDTPVREADPKAEREGCLNIGYNFRTAISLSP